MADRPKRSRQPNKRYVQDVLDPVTGATDTGELGSIEPVPDNDQQKPDCGDLGNSRVGRKRGRPRKTTAAAAQAAATAAAAAAGSDTPADDGVVLGEEDDTADDVRQLRKDG